MELIEQKFKELNHKWYYGQWPSQILIDFFEEVEEVFSNTDESDSETKDEIGSIIYQLGILKEVYNPALEYDILILNELIEILEAALKECELQKIIAKF